MILHHVVVHEGAQKMDAAVEYPAGVFRKIVFKWYAKDGDATIPAHWWDAVRQEAEFQRTAEAEEASGRKRI